MQGLGCHQRPFEVYYGLYMLSSGSGTIRRYGLVGVGMALLEWVYYCGCGLTTLILAAWKLVLC